MNKSTVFLWADMDYHNLLHEEIWQIFHGDDQRYTGIKDFLVKKQDEDFLHLKSMIDPIKEFDDSEQIIDILSENLYFRFEFSLNLRLYDVIKPNCFIQDNIISRGLVKILNRLHYIFIITEKEYFTEDDIHFCAYAIDGDISHEAMDKLIRGVIKFG